jgi:uncharacterized protein with HEPN domain
MQPPDYTWLADILIAARHVRNFVDGVDRDDFDGNAMRRSAIIHQLLVIGEATKRVSDPFRAAHPDIPWRKMAGMRDRLIHDYRQVDLEIVWGTATEMIPDLIRQVEPLVPPMDE